MVIVKLSAIYSKIQFSETMWECKTKVKHKCFHQANFMTQSSILFPLFLLIEFKKSFWMIFFKLLKIYETSQLALKPLYTFFFKSGKYRRESLERSPDWKGFLFFYSSCKHFENWRKSNSSSLELYRNGKMAIIVQISFRSVTKLFLYTCN